MPSVFCIFPIHTANYLLRANGPGVECAASIPPPVAPFISSVHITSYILPSSSTFPLTLSPLILLLTCPIRANGPDVECATEV